MRKEVTPKESIFQEIKKSDYPSSSAEWIMLLSHAYVARWPRRPLRYRVEINAFVEGSAMASSGRMRRSTDRGFYNKNPR